MYHYIWVLRLIPEISTENWTKKYNSYQKSKVKPPHRIIASASVFNPTRILMSAYLLICLSFLD